MATAGDELQPPTGDTADDVPSRPDHPHEAASNTEPTERMDTDAAVAAGADDTAEEVFSAGAAVDTDASRGAAVDTDASHGAAVDTDASRGAAVDTDASRGAAASTMKDLSELPFQLQITYTDLDGAEAVRVLTLTQPVTRDRLQAETSTSFCCCLLLVH